MACNILRLFSSRIRGAPPCPSVSPRSIGRSLGQFAAAADLFGVDGRVTRSPRLLLSSTGDKTNHRQSAIHPPVQRHDRLPRTGRADDWPALVVQRSTGKDWLTYILQRDVVWFRCEMPQRQSDDDVPVIFYSSHRRCVRRCRRCCYVSVAAAAAILLLAVGEVVGMTTATDVIRGMYTR